MFSVLGRFCRVLIVAFSGWVCASSAVAAQPDAPSSVRELSLNGEWESGIGRKYTGRKTVPGLAQDPGKPSPGILWYRRSVTLPDGDWNQATLTLKGARFQPQVYVDGQLVSSCEGGMAPTTHPLRSTAIAPGRTITLEIALRSLNEIDITDASAVPGADRWRSNVSSGLWDDVSLHFSGNHRLTRVAPWTDFPNRRLSAHWFAESTAIDSSVQAQVIDPSGRVIAEAVVAAKGREGVVEVALPSAVLPWTPEQPQIYRLRVSLLTGQDVQDTREMTWAFKQFESRDRRLYLNGEPIQLRGGTVVWHRFLRTPGVDEIAFSVTWFKEHITDRLKSYGANTLRYHLGLPPERLLDLCDREGLMVQLEWPFFHGIQASVASMKEQWATWLDVAARHPSVVIVHAWNETENPGELRTGWEALNAVLPHYPPLVVSHRDTVHIHKYWWSLFENLGLYYDSPEQFEATAIVDEFGGNYLDLKAEPGFYPTTRESYLRFLGREHTGAQRLELHALSNARVGEYWRRLGVAGIMPFCALGSPQDGNSWFLGSLQDPQPMPVWDALAATFSPLSVSLDVWDRNYAPGAKLMIPLHVFNDTRQSEALIVDVRVVDMTTGEVMSQRQLSHALAAGTRHQLPVNLTLPSRVGAWRLEAVLKNPPATVTHPVVSSWDIRTLAIHVPPSLANARIGIAENESELRQLLTQNGLKPVSLTDPTATILAGSSATWEALTASDTLRHTFSAAIHRGASVALLDVGPRDLGEGYRAKPLGTLDGAPRLFDPYEKTVSLFDSIRVKFRQQSEPESHFHPAPGNHDLWQHLPAQATWLWNGLRGGLVAPAADMEVVGLSQPALIAQWKERDADAAQLAAGKPYYAYRLADYYAYSQKPSDNETQDALRKRVRLLAEDAPALRDVLNSNAPIDQIDLAAAYLGAAQGRAESLQALASCGKNLTRTPIVLLSFSAASGRLLLSQVLTAGRLARGGAEAGLYGLRHDPAAEQFALNILAKALESDTAAH